MGHGLGGGNVSMLIKRLKNLKEIKGKNILIRFIKFSSKIIRSRALIEITTLWISSMVKGVIYESLSQLEIVVVVGQVR